MLMKVALAGEIEEAHLGEISASHPLIESPPQAWNRSIVRGPRLGSNPEVKYSV